MYIRCAPHLRLRSIFRLKSAPHQHLLYIVYLVSLKAIWLAPRRTFLNQDLHFLHPLFFKLFISYISCTFCTLFIR
ncbi:hypothetical protein Hanom_Chr09g00775971 [Helianthus anomalus]